jgi:hypothetical protein
MLSAADRADQHCVWCCCWVSLQDAALLRQIPWQYLLVDEAHRLKNSDSALYQELSGWSFKNKLLVTGTPLQVCACWGARVVCDCHLTAPALIPPLCSCTQLFAFAGSSVMCKKTLTKCVGLLACRTPCGSCGACSTSWSRVASGQQRSLRLPTRSRVLRCVTHCLAGWPGRLGLHAEKVPLGVSR